MSHIAGGELLCTHEGVARGYLGEERHDQSLRQTAESGDTSSPERGLVPYYITAAERWTPGCQGRYLIYLYCVPWHVHRSKLHKPNCPGPKSQVPNMSHLSAVSTRIGEMWRLQSRQLWSVILGGSPYVEWCHRGLRGWALGRKHLLPTDKGGLIPPFPSWMR